MEYFQIEGSSVNQNFFENCFAKNNYLNELNYVHDTDAEYLQALELNHESVFFLQFLCLLHKYYPQGAVTKLNLFLITKWFIKQSFVDSYS